MRLPKEIRLRHPPQPVVGVVQKRSRNGRAVDRKRKKREEKGGRKGEEKGTFYFFGYLRGRPRGFNDDSSPRRPAVRSAHLSLPNGVPRITERRSACNSASV